MRTRLIRDIQQPLVEDALGLVPRFHIRNAGNDSGK
jgi:hypothetical protein